MDDSLLVCVVLGHYKAETSAACCVAGGSSKCRSSIYNDQGSFSFLLEHRSMKTHIYPRFAPCILWMALYLCVVLGHYKAETSAACWVAG